MFKIKFKQCRVRDNIRYIDFKVAVACTQMPSSLPTNPNPSKVVAPIPTKLGSRDRAVAKFLVIDGICVRSFGFSAIMVAETL